MFHTVVIPSKGRASILAETVRSLASQTRKPDQIIVAVTETADVPTNLSNAQDVEIIYSDSGTTIQRNAAIEHLDKNTTLVSFIDDDVVLEDAYFEKALAFSQARPAVLAFDGNLVACGLKSGGMSRDEARVHLDRESAPTKEDFIVQAQLAGHNMNVKRDVLEHERFDEQLVRYAWKEDLDFARRVSRIGLVGRCMRCRIVHLGASSGRSAGVYVGYSQIANTFHIWRKRPADRLISTWELLEWYWGRHVAVNAAKSLYPGKKAVFDHSGRLKGNMLALRDVARRQCDPRKILEI